MDAKTKGEQIVGMAPNNKAVWVTIEGDKEEISFFDLASPQELMSIYDERVSVDDRRIMREFADQLIYRLRNPVPTHTPKPVHARTAVTFKDIKNSVSPPYNYDFKWYLTDEESLEFFVCDVCGTEAPLYPFEAQRQTLPKYECEICANTTGNRREANAAANWILRTLGAFDDVEVVRVDAQEDVA